MLTSKEVSFDAKSFCSETEEWAHDDKVYERSSPYGKESAHRHRLSLRSVDSEEFITPAAGHHSRQGSLPSSVFALVSTIVGGGVLSLPYSMSRAGVVVGPFFFLFIALSTNFSIYVLVSSSRRSGMETYEEVAHRAFQKKAQIFSVFLTLALIWFAMVGYLVLMGDLLPPVLNFACQWRPDRMVAILVCLALVFPLSCMSRLHSLRFTSFLALLSVVFLAVAVLYRAIEQNTHHEPLPFKLAPESFQDALSSLPIVTCAFVCHFNCLPVHAELHDPTRVRMTRIVNITIGFCFVLYTVIGLAGYFYAHDLTRPNILDNFPDDDPLITCGRVALLLTVMLTYPLLVLPARDSLLSLAAHIQDGVRYLRDPEGYSALPIEDEDDGDSSDEHSSQLVDFSDKGTVKENMVTLAIRVVVTLLMVGSALFVAYIVPAVTTIWSIVGSSISIIIAFILPGAFYLKIRAKKSMNPRKVGCFALVVVGMVMAVLCTYQSVSEIVSA